MSDEIISLIAGNKQFRKNYFNGENNHFEQLILHGQKPKVCVVACSDSRVNPDLAFNCQPGELFMVRTVAALVPPFARNNNYPATGAALEFSIESLDVRHIILLGHSHCGGIEWVVKRGTQRASKKADNVLGKWLELAHPAYEKVLAEHPQVSFEEQVTLCTQYALITSLNTLYSYPWVQKRVNNNQLAIHAWYLDLKTGKIQRYDQKKEYWIAL